MGVMMLLALIAAAVFSNLAARLIARHDDARDRLRHWNGRRWATVGDEAEQWLHHRGDPGPSAADDLPRT